MADKKIFNYSVLVSFFIDVKGRTDETDALTYAAIAVRYGVDNSRSLRLEVCSSEEVLEPAKDPEPVLGAIPNPPEEDHTQDGLPPMSVEAAEAREGVKILDEDDIPF